MQRALSSSELTGPPIKPNSAANKISPSAANQKTTAPNQGETVKTELSKSDAPGSPQKTQTTAVTHAAKAAKGPESGKQASPTPGQKTPLDIPGASAPDTSKTTESMTGKMFGFGSSIFSSASTLISSAVQEESRTTPPGARKMSAPAQVSPKLSAVPKISPKSTPTVSPKMSPAREPKTVAQKPEQAKKPEKSQQSKDDKAPAQPPKEATCPLCKVELNVRSKDLPNYNTCTECKNTVCNQCGFNPMPNETGVREWLCLNCQMQRALGASEPPGLPMIKPQVSPNKDVPATTQKKEPPVSASQEDIPKPATPKNELVNVASTKEIESPAPDVPTKKMIPTAASLPDKTVTSTATKTDVSPASQKPSGETPKGQPDKTQQQPAKAVVSTAKAEAGKPSPQQPPKAGTSPATAAPPPAQPAKQESGGFFGFGSPKTKPAAAKPAESVTGKMFGFGSSFLSSASTLITSAVQDEPKPTPPTPRKMSTTAHVSPKTTPPASPKTVPAKDTKPPAIQKTEEKKPEKPQQDKTPTTVQVRVDKAPSVIPKAPADTQGAPKADQSTCPLCKVELNMGSKDSPNYNTCTECKMTVCNQCGFNPMPNVTEVNQHPHNCLCFHLTYCCYKRELK
uniref:Zinc finger piccolo-type domain-containing protein n=1 Tax=Seriola dumerili TaxID=41447 RepID=A0A3B4UL07_SERDU